YQSIITCIYCYRKLQQRGEQCTNPGEAVLRRRFVAMFTSNKLLELMAQIMGAFQESFNKTPSWKATLLDWERCAFAFGSVKDRPRSGKKKTREETCAGVAASIEQSPIKFDM
ncbi:hypothetical protein C0J52_01667, partial [Blattella germanica]